MKKKLSEYTAEDIENLKVVYETKYAKLLAEEDNSLAIYNKTKESLVTKFIYDEIITTASIHSFIGRYGASKNKYRIITDNGTILVNVKAEKIVIQIGHMVLFKDDDYFYSIYDLAGECVCKTFSLSENQVQTLIEQFYKSPSLDETFLDGIEDKNLAVLCLMILMGEQYYKVAQMGGISAEEYLQKLNESYNFFKTMANKLISSIPELTKKKMYYIFSSFSRGKEDVDWINYLNE